MHNDGAATGSPLGPVLGNIFVVELERTITPFLIVEIKLWKRFVDDKIIVTSNSQWKQNKTVKFLF